METGWLRDAEKDKYLADSAASFMRLPTVNEHVWIEEKAYRVEAVSHAWDAVTGEPYAVLDLKHDEQQAPAVPRVPGPPTP